MHRSLILALLALLVLLAACSNPAAPARPSPTGTGPTPEVVNALGTPPPKEDVRPGPDRRGTAAPAPLVTPSPAPVVRGGRARELIPRYPRTLNPLLTEGETEERVGSLLYDGLMEIDPQTKLPAPALASSLSVSPDGRTYTFVLREGVRWSDGAPLSSEDVVWAYRMLRDPDVGAPLQPYAERVRTVRALGPDSVRFTLSEPYAPFLARLATAGIVPRGPYLGLRGARLRTRLLRAAPPPGTGPFRWSSARPGQGIELAANPLSFRGAPLLDGYSFRVVRDPAAAAQALIGGEADLAWLSPQAAREVSEQDFLTQSPLDTPTVAMLLFNLDPRRRSAQSDVRVRRALAHALNSDRASSAMDGAVQPSGGFQPPTSAAHRPDEGRSYPYNRARAERLLERAGWIDEDGDGVREKGGRRLEIAAFANDVPQGFPSALGGPYEPALRSIAEDWRAVGVRVRVRTEGWERLASRLFLSHDFDVTLLGIQTDADPDQSYLWAADAYPDAFNIGRYEDERADALLLRGLRAADPTGRAQAYAELDWVLVSDVPAVPLGVSRVMLVQNNRLLGPDADYWSALQHTGVERWSVQDGG